MRLSWQLIGLFLALVSSSGNAMKMDGVFTAKRVCPAYQSFTKLTNPGNLNSDVGRSYQILEENKPNGSWVLVLIPEDPNSRRWIAKECGVLDVGRRIAQQKSSLGSAGASEECNAANSHDSYVLALTWQAGFCEHFKYKGTKPECDNLNSGNLTITNLTIHGLWPNKASCGTGYGYCATSELSLNKETINKISPWMPNWYYASDFGRHEWSKHGSCQGLSDDDYFLLTQKLAEKFDASELGKYVRANMGKYVAVANMQNHLSSVMGADVVKKIELRCVGGKYLNEFWISLPATIKQNSPIKDLVLGAKDKKRFSGNCGEKIYIEVPGNK